MTREFNKVASLLAIGNVALLNFFNIGGHQMYTKEVLEKTQDFVTEASDSLSRALEYVGQEDCEFFVLEEASSVIINLFKALALMVNKELEEE